MIRQLGWVGDGPQRSLVYLLPFLLHVSFASAEQVVVDDSKTINSYLEAETTLSQSSVILGISKLAKLHGSSEYQKSIKPLVAERLASIKKNLPHFFWSLETQGNQRRYKSDEILLDVNGLKLPFTVNRNTSSKPIGTIKYGTDLYSGLDDHNRYVTQLQIQHSLTAYEDDNVKNSFSLAWTTPYPSLDSTFQLRLETDKSNFSKRSPSRVGVEFKTFFETQKILTVDFDTGTNYVAITPQADEQRFSQWKIRYNQPIANTHFEVEQKWYEDMDTQLRYSQLGAKLSLPQNTGAFGLTFDVSARNYGGIQYPFHQKRTEKKIGIEINTRPFKYNAARLYTKYSRNYSNIDIFSYETLDFGVLIQN